MFESPHIQLIPADLLAAAPIDHRYDDSPFRLLKTLPIKTRGDRMEDIVEFLAKVMGQTVNKRTDGATHYDRWIGAEKVEIKSATLGFHADHFTFNQLRPDQDYDATLFAMFYPHHIIMMEMPKSLVVDLTERGIFKAQHGGNDGDSRTFSYTGNEFTLAEIGATEVSWSQSTKSFNYGRGIEARFVSIPLY